MSDSDLTDAVARATKASSAQEIADATAARMYAADTASQALGIDLSGIAPGRATATMTVTAGMVQGHGTCHGGYLFLLADSAFAFACNSHGPATVAAACDIVFLTPVHEGDELVAEAVERVTFGRSGICDVTVRRTNGGSPGEVVAEFRGRSRTIGR